MIPFSKVSLNYDNGLTIKPLPTTSNERSTTTPETKTLLINLVALKKMFTVNGGIIQGQLQYSNGLNETNTNATAKKNSLKSMIESGETLTFIYEGISYSGVITKLDITETARDLQAVPNDSDYVYDVTFSFVVGVDKIAGN